MRESSVRHVRPLLLLWTLAALVAACGRGGGEPAGAPETSRSRLRFAIAIHGGAGVPERSLSAEQQEAYRGSLERALDLGRGILAEGGTALDAVEGVVRDLEDDPLFNAGKGAVFTGEGVNELDASIMDGSTLDCGAVTGVRDVKNPVSLARLVMERTPHVLLAGAGAERFAEEMQVERVDPEYFFTERRWEALQRFRRERAEGPGTVGAVALDRRGDLAAATSTGGLTGKMPGRVGDSPIIGAGTYADNLSCAISASGKGEEFIRHGVALSISALMTDRGLSLQEAATRIVGQKLRPGDGGIIGVDREGRIAMVYNTPGMFRGAADSEGRFEVHIWE